MKTIEVTFIYVLGNLKKLIITQQIDFGRAKNNLQVRRVHSKINKKRNEIILQRQEDLKQNRYYMYYIFIIYYSYFPTHGSKLNI